MKLVKVEKLPLPDDYPILETIPDAHNPDVYYIRAGQHIYVIDKRTADALKAKVSIWETYQLEPSDFNK